MQPLGAQQLEQLVAPGSELRAEALAPALEALLNDRGKRDDKGAQATPNLTEFWNSTDPKVQALRREVVRLRDDAKYGDAFVIGGHFGKGRVVAVMTTAGKDWNNWGGGSAATPLYPGFIWETQNYLSGQGSESNLKVGAPVEIVALGYNTPIENIHHREPEHLRMFHHLLSLQAGAYQNAAWVLAAAKCGAEDGFAMIGGSAIVAPTGEIAARALSEEDEVISVDLDL